MFAGPPKSYERSVMSALPRALLGLRVVREAKSNGYTHALLQYGEAGSSQILFVVVDVMRELWTEDAALRALDRVLATEFRPQAYLLVVDAVADRARERIEDAFARAPLAALLAVWRGDQPVDDLAQAVKPLARQLSELTRS